MDLIAFGEGEVAQCGGRFLEGGARERQYELAIGSQWKEVI